MIINQSTITTNYLVASPRLKHDVKHWRNIPLSAVSRWTPADIMKRLVDAGLAEVASTYKDGSIAEIRAEQLSIEQVEAVCLSADDVARIDGWLQKGIVR